VVSQQALVNLALYDLQTTTGHVGFANSLNFLEAILVAQLIVSVVGLVK
jgi:hypothetical protein